MSFLLLLYLAILMTDVLLPFQPNWQRLLMSPFGVCILHVCMDNM